MPLISIIIPVYNSADYLAKCLDSVLAQTYSDFEVLCVNDGSTDNCGQILADYAARDSRIHVLTQSNQGQAVARNKALDIARGRYVFFLDSDDQLAPYALSVFYKVAKDSASPVVVSRMTTSSLQPQPSLTWEKHTNVLADFVSDRRIFSPVWNKLYRRSVLANRRFIPGIYFEDWPFLLQVFGQIDSYVTMDMPCYIYNEGNVSTTRSAFTTHKIDSYVCGIRAVYNTYWNSSALLLVQKRMAVAIKMMVGKVYKAQDKDLTAYLLKQLQALFDEKIIRPGQLTLKTRYRLWKLKHPKKQIKVQ